MKLSKKTVLIFLIVSLVILGVLFFRSNKIIEGHGGGGGGHSGGGGRGGRGGGGGHGGGFGHGGRGYGGFGRGHRGYGGYGGWIGGGGGTYEVSPILFDQYYLDDGYYDVPTRSVPLLYPMYISPPFTENIII
jgi:hypothetical protein